MQYDFEFRSRRSNVLSTRGVAAASQPLASLAGLDMLRAGGNAADTAVAMAAALNVVAPFSTGVGGDCFALYWDAATRQVYALNGSGPAAKNANIEAVRKQGYEEMPQFMGQAVSVPGTAAGWEALLARFGTLSLADVLAPAIRYAVEGYPLTEWVGAGWELMASRLLRENVDESLPLHLQRGGPPQPSGHEYLVDGGAPRVGDVVTLATLGETLRLIAAEGKDAIYEGDFAEQLCAHVQRYGGWLTPEDLHSFEAEWVEPITADYRGVRLYECPPNGQGLAAIMAVKIAAGFELGEMTASGRTHILIECMRLGLTEALGWVSDPHFEAIPYEGLFDEDYIESRRAMIREDRAISHLETEVQPVGEDTVYVSVVDGAGNACSFINSLYMGGGTGLVVPGTGVFLQNRAALFSLDPAHPNALAGGKRPYHTIIPGMLTKDGELYGSFGIMGGFMQPQAHLQVLSNLVDLGNNPQQALDMPRFRLDVTAGGGVGAADPGGLVHLEPGLDADALTGKGHWVDVLTGRGRALFGGGQIVLRDAESGVITAGSDGRKDGCAMGY
ncbi:gamma-glutamyltransferase family protein [bacterium]|nr:gamma-glutamyltransferase family protein [bacterium]